MFVELTSPKELGSTNYNTKINEFSSKERT